MRGATGDVDKKDRTRPDGPRIGLALGGGGARGLAHIGVLEVLEEERVPIDLIAGTSIGSIIGGSYALEPDAADLRKRTLAYVKSDPFERLGLQRFRQTDPSEQNLFDSIFLSLRRGLAFTYLLRRPSLFSGSVLEKTLAETVPDKTFDDVRIPLAVSAVDLIEGEEVTMRAGSLRKAMLASISLSGFFPPVPMEGRLLADMGFLGAVPADVAADLGANLIVAVDVSPNFISSNGANRLSTGLQILFRLESITARALREVRLESSHVIIRPTVGGVHWADFSRAEEIVEKGKEATRRALPKIRAALAKRSRPGPLRRALDAVLRKNK